MNIQSKKTRQIIEAARFLFMKYGFRRVTVEEICRKADVSKMTFYKYFEGKTEVFKSVLGDIFRGALARYRAIMDSPAPFRNKVQAIIRMKLELSEEVGKEYIRDILSGADPEIASFILGLKQESVRQFLDDLKELQASGQVRPGLRPEFISYLYDLILESFKDGHLLGLFPTTEDLTAEWMNFLFYGIVGPENRSGEGR